MISYVSDRILADAPSIQDSVSCVGCSFYLAGVLMCSLVDIVAIISLVCNCTIHPSLSYEPWDYHPLLVRPMLLAIDSQVCPDPWVSERPKICPNGTPALMTWLRGAFQRCLLLHLSKIQTRARARVHMNRHRQNSCRTAFCGAPAANCPVGAYQSAI